MADDMEASAVRASNHVHPSGTNLHELKPIEGWRLAVIFLGLSICLLLSFMDETIVATALVDISVEFNDFSNSIWIVLAYTLTYLGFAVLASRLADCYGRRHIMIAGATIFFAFSFGSGFAQNINQLIAFRALQGVGGSVMYSIGIICFPELSPIHLLPLATSIVGVVLAIAGALGPLLGGIFTSYADWRWCFWINPPILLPTILGLYFLWPRGPERGEHLAYVKITQVDWFGATLLLLFTTLFTLSIQQAGSRAYAWDSATIIVLLVVASLGFIALLAWSWFLAHTARLKNIAAMLPWDILTNRVLMTAIISTMLTGFTGLVVVIWLPVYYQIVNVLSPVQAGIHLLPSVCSLAVGAAVGGLISMKNNYTWISIIAGNCLVLIGCGLFSAAPASLEVANIIYAAQVIAGFGTGMTLAVTTMIISLNASFKDHALGQGIVAQVRVIGGTLSVAMGGAIFGNHIAGLTDVLTPAEIETLTRNVAYISQLEILKQVSVRDAFSVSFTDTMRICTYVAAANLVISFFVWQKHPPSIQERKEQLEAAMQAPVSSSNSTSMSETTETPMVDLRSKENQAA